MMYFFSLCARKLLAALRSCCSALASWERHICRPGRCARCEWSCALQKVQAGLAVDAKDGVFDFGVGGRVDAAADKLVAGVDVFDFAERGGTKNVLQHDVLPG